MKDISGILDYFLALPLHLSMTPEKSFASIFKCTKAEHNLGWRAAELFLLAVTHVATGKGEEQRKG